MNDGKLYGFYRSQVVEVDISQEDLKEYGAVRVWVPDLMVDNGSDDIMIPKTRGLIAFPANNPLGGRNLDNLESFGHGTVYVPRKGDWVWIFFEGGDLKKPYYWNALNFLNAKLPPENRVDFEGNSLSEPHRVYTILRTYEGRSIVFSDDEKTQRIEITGRKRKGPAISPEALNQDGTYYAIDDNQTVILFDERREGTDGNTGSDGAGLEKILIRTRLGDFLHIDIDERKLQAYFKDDIVLKTDSNLHFQVGQDVHWEVGNDYFLTVKNDTHIKSLKNIYTDAGEERHETSGSHMYVTAGGSQFTNVTGDMKAEVGGDNLVKGQGNFNADYMGHINLISHGGNVNLQAVAGDINNEAGVGIYSYSVSGTHVKSTGILATDGSSRWDQSGMALMPTDKAVSHQNTTNMATIATPSTPAEPVDPKGERET